MRCEWCEHRGELGVDLVGYKSWREGLITVCMDREACDRRDAANERERERSLDPEPV